jgi:hypothetical protein
VQIIFVDRRLSRARTLNLSRRMLAAAAAGLFTAVVLAVIGLYAVTFRAAAEFRVPLVHDLIAFVMRDEVARNEQFTRDNVTAMARKLGEMQAQLMRLDALGERVAKLAGIRPEEFNFKELPGRGGAIPAEARAMTMNELQHELDRVARGVGHREDYMDIVESEFLSTQVRRALLPQNAPLSEGFVGSSFGMRTDPFTGQLAMHAGVDFAAPTGTPIYAAAGGVVSSAEMNPVYGNTVEVDHGNDLRTRYAHASKIVVKPGDIVKRGQKLAEVGSTGRSTGPHLHFEVHLKGVPQNPSKFLIAQKPGSPLGQLAAVGGKSNQTAPAAAPRTPARRAAPVTATAPAAPEAEARPETPAETSSAQPAPAVVPAPQVDLKGLAAAAAASN